MLLRSREVHEIKGGAFDGPRNAGTALSLG